jgi:hypothetical protein
VGCRAGLGAVYDVAQAQGGALPMTAWLGECPVPCEHLGQGFALFISEAWMGLEAPAQAAYPIQHATYTVAAPAIFYWPAA